jgi:hypothetical protein
MEKIIECSSDAIITHQRHLYNKGYNISPNIAETLGNVCFIIKDPNIQNMQLKAPKHRQNNRILHIYYTFVHLL